MIVHLTSDAPPSVSDVDRFDRLHAVASLPVADVDLGSLARPADADHVWLDVSELRSAGLALATDDGFGEQFDGMIAFAAKHGWLDADGTHVRAHVVAP